MKPEEINFRPSEEQFDDFPRKVIPRINALIENMAKESYDGLEGIKWKDLAQMEWHTTKDAARFLKISIHTLNNYCSQGKISYYKRDRVTDVKIEVKKNKKNSKSPMGSGGYGFREFHIEDLIKFRKKYNRRIQSELDDI